MRKLLFLLILILLIISISMCEKPEAQSDDYIIKEIHYSSEEELFADSGIDIEQVVVVPPRETITINSAEELEVYKSSLDPSSEKYKDLERFLEIAKDSVNSLDNVSLYPMTFIDCTQ